ncbi:MAG TPA: glycoside hydrolase family 3 N-terminal domain-containing protein [Acidimicrobiales bacterium]|nr:glycoside hydrolase family 3 N-terminal domain-containing protein [Acidimicrobiales bacterium]
MTAGSAALAAALLAACSSPGPGPSATPTTLPSTTAAPAATTTGAATSTTRPSCSDQSVIASWPLSKRAAQLVVAPVLEADPAAVRVAVSAGAGGLILIGAVPGPAQLRAALAPVTAASPRPMVMADEEGGAVQRLEGDVVAIPSARQMAATMTPAQVQQLAAEVGRQMKALGVGVDLAPVVDLDAGAGPSARDPDGTRSFSADPDVASRYAQAFAAGLTAGGVIPVFKHFPGLGGSTGNTDYGAAPTPPLAQLQHAGLIPFQRAAGAGAQAVMVSNATVPGLTSVPVSLSAAAVTGLLRDQIHFRGLVLTDSLSAGAIRAAGRSVPAAATAAVSAGADMVLFGSTLTAADRAQLAPGPLSAEIAAIVGALSGAVRAGTLPEARLDAAVLDVVRARGTRLCPAR